MANDKANLQKVLIWLPLLGVIAVYLPGLANHFTWDDQVLIEDNESLRDFRNLGKQLTVDFWDSSVQVVPASGFYRPVVKAMYLVEYQLFGGRPAGFLAVNLVLHLCCVFLVFRFLRRNLDGASPSAIAASIGSFVFAIHPTKVESVSWSSGSTDLWMTFFVLCGFEFWQFRSRITALISAALCFLLAFLSKETALIVPLVLAGDLIAGTPSPEKRADAARLAIVSAALSIGVWLHLRFVPVRYSPSTDWSIGRVVPRALASWGMYLERAFFPWPVTTQAGASPMDTNGIFLIAPIHLWIGAGGVLALVGSIAVALKRPRTRGLVRLLLMFALPLVPVLNILPLNYRYLTADRFLYWPLIGLVGALAWVLLTFVSGQRTRLVVLASTVMLATFWAQESEKHILHFKSNHDLWSYEYGLDPANQYVAESFARTLWAEDQPTMAMPIAEKAVALARTSADLTRSTALYAAISLDTIPDAEQRRLTAIRDFLDQMADSSKSWLRLEDGRVKVGFSPHSSERRRVQFGRGFDLQRALAHMRTNDLEGAEAQLRAIIASKPALSSPWIRLVQLKALQDDWENAEQTLREARLRFTGDKPLQELEQKLQKSRQRLARAAEGEPDKSLAKAEALLAIGFPSRALRTVRALRERYPTNSQIATTQGRIEAVLQRQ